MEAQNPPDGPGSAPGRIGNVQGQDFRQMFQEKGMTLGCIRTASEHLFNFRSALEQGEAVGKFHHQRVDGGGVEAGASKFRFEETAQSLPVSLELD